MGKVKAIAIASTIAAPLALGVIASSAAHAQGYGSNGSTNYTTQRLGNFDYTTGSDGSHYTTQHLAGCGKSRFIGPRSGI